MDQRTATLRLFSRASPKQSWEADKDAVFDVVVGKAGLAWGNGFAAYAGKREHTKVEGDQRTPAGVFPIGRTFGFAAQSFPGHIVLKSGDTICVDDPASPHYNKIVSRKDAGKVASAEDMPAIPLYRKGIAVDYASDRVKRTGSCIFLHVWRSPGEGTAGCVAMPEATVERVQAFTRAPAALAVLPYRAPSDFSRCLPGVDLAELTERKARSPR